MTAPEDDPRITPRDASSIGGELLRAAHRADDVYEDRIKEALDEYREPTSNELESRY